MRRSSCHENLAGGRAETGAAASMRVATLLTSLCGAHFAEAVQLVASTEQLLDEAQTRVVSEEEQKVAARAEVSRHAKVNI